VQRGIDRQIRHFGSFHQPAWAIILAALSKERPEQSSKAHLRSIMIDLRVVTKPRHRFPSSVHIFHSEV
jgi:hypothetical protein